MRRLPVDSAVEEKARCTEEGFGKCSLQKIHQVCAGRIIKI